VSCTAAVCLSACSGAEPRPESGTPNITEADLAELVEFGSYVQTLDDWECDEQYEHLVTQYRASPSNDRAIMLSLLLSRPGAKPHALAEALVLLTDARNGRGEHTELGRVIYELIGERYLEATHAESLATLLSEARDHSSRLDAELAEMRAALAAAERERTALTQRLEAFKAIEERLTLDSNPKSQ